MGGSRIALCAGFCLAVSAAHIVFADDVGTWEQGEPAWPADYWNNYTNRIDSLKADYTTVSASAGHGSLEAPIVFNCQRDEEASDPANLKMSQPGTIVIVN